MQMTKEELDEERKQKIEALYREQYATIFFYAKTIFCQPGGPGLGRAEDAAQETFLVALKRADKVLSSPNPAGWLINACKRVCQTLFREEGKWYRNLRMVESRTDRDEAVPFSSRVDLEGFVPPEDFQILWGIYLEGCSQKEIGEELGLKAPAVSMKVKRIKEKFLTQYKKIL